VPPTATIAGVPDQPRGAAFGRRAVLVLPPAILLAACTAPSKPTSRPSGTSSSPDAGLAATALAAVMSTRRLTARSAARHPELRTELAGLAAMHAAHASALERAVPERSRPAAPPVPVPPRAAAARLRVLASEHALARSLAELALRAQSGEFARLLAAMAASVAQHLAALG
jgi:hypothetical protein